MTQWLQFMGELVVVPRWLILILVLPGIINGAVYTVSLSMRLNRWLKKKMGQVDAPRL